VWAGGYGWTPWSLQMPRCAGARALTRVHAAAAVEARTDSGGCVVSGQVPGEQWVPGSIATVALFMINSVRRWVALAVFTHQSSPTPPENPSSENPSCRIETACGIGRSLRWSSARCVGEARIEPSAMFWSCTRKPLPVSFRCEPAQSSDEVWGTAGRACGCTTPSMTARTVAFGPSPNPHPYQRRIALPTRET